MTQQSKLAEYLLLVFLTIIIYNALERLGLVEPIFIFEDQKDKKNAVLDLEEKDIATPVEESEPGKIAEYYDSDEIDDFERI